MRLFYGALLILAIGAGALFAVQNNDGVNVNYMSWSASLSLPLLVGGAYVLGMVTGGAVVGSIRHSLHRATESPRPRA